MLRLCARRPELKLTSVAAQLQDVQEELAMETPHLARMGEKPPRSSNDLDLFVALSAGGPSLLVAVDARGVARKRRTVVVRGESRAGAAAEGRAPFGKTVAAQCLRPSKTWWAACISTICCGRGGGTKDMELVARCLFDSRAVSVEMKAIQI